METNKQGKWNLIDFGKQIIFLEMKTFFRCVFFNLYFTESLNKTFILVPGSSGIGALWYLCNKMTAISFSYQTDLSNISIA